MLPNVVGLFDRYYTLGRQRKDFVLVVRQQAKRKMKSPIESKCKSDIESLQLVSLRLFTNKP